jgi:redox-sensitive bicupin YhaK (pirin superfamily)
MRSVRAVIPAFKVNMGGILLDQALPANGIDSIDPFLLLHHWKGEIKSNSRMQDNGVGPHPHRGFSPVTFVVNGELVHQDSRGNRSLTQSGGVQWMNSGMGIIHSERPSKRLSETGGPFEIIQLWVNTPENHKFDPPEYYSIDSESTPELMLGTKSYLKIVSGEYQTGQGPIPAKSQLILSWLNGAVNEEVSMELSASYNLAIYIIEGGLKCGSMSGHSKDLLYFDNASDQVQLRFTADTKALFLAGVPLAEPVVSQGPFVMNNSSQIMEAMLDYQKGKMGFLVEEFI